MGPNLLLPACLRFRRRPETVLPTSAGIPVTLKLFWLSSVEVKQLIPRCSSRVLWDPGLADRRTVGFASSLAGFFVPYV